MNYGNNILIPFNMIYDIDIGIFLLIKTKYNNPEYIDQNIVQMTHNNFKYMMSKITKYDPLSILLKNEYQNNSIDILNDIFKTQYDEILKLAEPTDLLGLMSVYMKTSLVKISILCDNEIQFNIIKNNNVLKGVNIIIDNNNSKLNIENYDSIFIKKYEDILKFRKVQGKSIFIGNYKFNHDETSTEENILPVQEISILIGDVNRIYFVDLYNMDESYPIYG